MYSTNKVHTPDEIFEAIGAEIKGKNDNKDYTVSDYLIAYQGGYFSFTQVSDLGFKQSERLFAWP